MNPLQARKQELRQEFFRRWRLSLADRAQMLSVEKQLQQKFWRLCGKLLQDRQKKVLSYKPLPSEIAVGKFFKNAHCQIYFPQIFGSSLLACSLDGRRFLELYAMDLILVPCLLFRSDGVRLGRGGGYWDRALRFLPQHKTLLLARHWQLEESIPAEEHDIPVRRWLTEQGIHPPVAF